MNNVETNSDFLIKNWFYNMNKSTENNSILVIIISTKKSELKVQIKQLVNKDISLLDIAISAKSIRAKLINSQMNKNLIIIIDPLNHEQFPLSEIHKKLLIIPEHHNFFKNINEYVSNETYKELSILENEHYQYWLHKENLKDLLENQDSQYLNNLIMKKIWMIDQLYNEDIDRLILKNTSFNGSAYQNKSISMDINMLCQHKILTSRLAILIYRVSLLDINANVTKIGREIHRLTNSRSKTFSTQMIKNLYKDIINSISTDLLIKNFKAYDLNINNAEIAIRTEIANNLLSFNIDGLTLDMIAESTNLPLNIIQRLQNNIL